MQDSTLTLDKVLNTLIYGSPFCAIIYRSYDLSKTIRFLWLKLIGIFGVVSFPWIYTKNI